MMLYISPMQNVNKLITFRNKGVVRKTGAIFGMNKLDLIGESHGTFTNKFLFQQLVPSNDF